MVDTESQPELREAPEREAASTHAFVRRLFRAVPVAIPIAIALIAFRGIFNVSEVFFLRDLSGYYWPFFLGIRDVIAQGDSVGWDPFVGFGRPLLSDPVAQLLFPPALVARLSPSTALAFNFYVTLPFPIAAIGTYLYIRGASTRAAASIGAVIFVVSGPVLSSGNMPNLSWTVACLPWVLVATRRLKEHASAGRFAALATLFAVQYLAGEPVLLTATAALAVLTSAIALDANSVSVRARALAAVRAVAAGLSGLLLAAPSALMFLSTASRSFRVVQGGSNVEGVSVHPLGLLETLVPGLFGDFIRNGPAAAPLQIAFSGGEPPLLFSLFLGSGALILASVGFASGLPRRWVWFWFAILAVGIAFSVGYATPIYPLVHRAVPVLQSFRSPSKYIIIGAFAVACLAASGWDALTRSHGSLTRSLVFPSTIALFGLVGAVVTRAVPGPVATWLASLTVVARVPAPLDAARQVVANAQTGALRLLGTTLAVAALIWLIRALPTSRQLLLASLYALISVDLLSAGLHLNPTLPTSYLAEPAWVASTRAHPDDRVYTLGKLPRSANGAPDPDDAFFNIPPVAPGTYSGVNAIVSAQTVPQPLPWRVREAMSLDMPLLAPREYIELASAVKSVSAEDRSAFLSRVGVRYFLLNHAPALAAERVFDVPRLAPLALYEATPSRGRAVVVPGYIVEPDLDRRCGTLVSRQFAHDRGIILESQPPDQSGTPGPGLDPSATITSETSTTVDVTAHVPNGGGFLLLQDSYDPYWRATVDGTAAPIVRADVVFRAVPLTPGDHRVRFTYVPVPFYVGIAVSVATALALLALIAVERFRRRRTAP